MIYIGDLINDKVIGKHLKYMSENKNIVDLNKLTVKDFKFELKEKKFNDPKYSTFLNCIVNAYNDIMFKIKSDLGHGTYYSKKKVNYVFSNTDICRLGNFITLKPNEMNQVYNKLNEMYPQFINLSEEKVEKEAVNFLYKKMAGILGYSTFTKISYGKIEAFEKFINEDYLKKIGVIDTENLINEIIKGKPKEVNKKKFSIEFLNLNNHFYDTLKNIKVSSKSNNELNDILKDLIVEFTYKIRHSLINGLSMYDERFLKWDAYLYVMELGLKVCPYCNANFIPTVIKPWTGVGTRPDIDHFLPKSIFPYFSMSIFNLIPSCKICNSSFKGDKSEFINGVNPFQKGFGPTVKFEYIFKGSNAINNIDDIDSIFIDLIVNKYVDDEEKNQLSINMNNFSTRLLYDQFSSEARLFFEKYRKINNSSLKLIDNVIKGINIKDVEKAKRYYLDVVESESEFKNKVMSKMKYDLYNDLKSYEYKKSKF